MTQQTPQLSDQQVIDMGADPDAEPTATEEIPMTAEQLEQLRRCRCNDPYHVRNANSGSLHPENYPRSKEEGSDDEDAPDQDLPRDRPLMMGGWLLD